MGTRTIADEPTAHLVSFGREICGDLAAGLRREWLVTNGLGGYASGTLAGIATRRYHGLLIAALTPPVERTTVVGGLVEWAMYDGRRYPLSTHEYGDGTIDAHGYRYLQSFHLEGMLPVWTFALADALVEKRVWMAYGANTTYITYRVLRGTRAVTLEVMPLVTYRDFHALAPRDGWRPEAAVTSEARGVTVGTARADVRILANDGQFSARGDWYWNFRHREETARGLDDRSDLYAPGAFTATLCPGDTFALTCTTAAEQPATAGRALAAAQARQIALLRCAGAEAAHPTVRQLVLAADQFIVARERGAGSGEQDGATSPGRTVIAGYHWFNDWGRDTMIALPGLTLATGRAEDAADILRTFARYVDQGLLPNNFPDGPEDAPGYNTVDATLWYVLAVEAYRAATGDEHLVDELVPVLRDIVAWHLRGTRHGIAVDPADGLLRAGEPGVQLTWMDARVGDWVVTPRVGKPVEINALWYNALRIIAAFLKARGDAFGETCDLLAERVCASFSARFLRAGAAHLADVVDGPDGDDWTVRPNEIFAVSLPHPLLEGERAAALVDAVGRGLLADCGLRSLSPDDSAYRGEYGGDVARRDGGYHQGTAWTWLLPHYAEAHLRVYRDPARALALLRPLEHHLRDAGLGTVSEILDGDPPHQPHGCIAQAWGVAEMLRVWRLLAAG